MSIARMRLTKERADWRRDHPLGFSARYMQNADGPGQDIMKWICKIPGKKVLTHTDLGFNLGGW